MLDFQPQRDIWNEIFHEYRKCSPYGAKTYLTGIIELWKGRPPKNPKNQISCILRNRKRAQSSKNVRQKSDLKWETETPRELTNKSSLAMHHRGKERKASASLTPNGASLVPLTSLGTLRKTIPLHSSSSC